MPTLIRKPVITVLIGVLTLVGLVTAPFTANAATPNWFAKSCVTITRNCTELTDVDKVLATRTIVFRDGSGHRVVAKHRAQVWRLAHQHAKPCPKTGDLIGCYFTDPFAGKSVVLADGMSISLRLFRP